MPSYMFELMAQEQDMTVSEFLGAAMERWGSASQIAIGLDVSLSPVNAVLKRHGWKREGTGLNSVWISPDGKRYEARENLPKGPRNHKVPRLVKRVIETQFRQTLETVSGYGADNVELNNDLQEALCIISERADYQAGVNVQVDDLHGAILYKLQQKQLIEVADDGAHKYAQLRDIANAVSNGYIPPATPEPGYKPNYIAVRPYSPPPNSHTETPVVTADHTCKACAHSRVLNILRARSPKLERLIDSLMAAETLMDEMVGRDE